MRSVSRRVMCSDCRSRCLPALQPRSSLLAVVDVSAGERGGKAYAPPASTNACHTPTCQKAPEWACGRWAACAELGVQGVSRSKQAGSHRQVHVNQTVRARAEAVARGRQLSADWR